MSELTEGKPVRVLHVDDDREFLGSASQMLELQGDFQVETATSVQEALGKLKTESFDAVVSDYLMPGKNGLDFLKELRERGNEIPFVMFTGKGKEEVAMEALNLGADRYLNKRGDPEVVYGELTYSIQRAVERYVVRRELEAREERFRVFLEGFQGIAYQIRVRDTEGKTIEGFEILLLQGNVEGITGYAAEDFLSGEKTWREVIHPDDLQSVLQKGQKILSNPGHVADEEYRILHKSGKTKWVRDISRASKTGKLLQGTIYDISERKRVEKQLREAEEWYRAVFENTGTAMCILEEDKTISMVNKQFEELSGYSREEVEGKRKWTEFVTPEYLERMKEYHRERRKKGGKAPRHYSADFVDKEGKIKHGLLTVDLIPGTKKSVVSILDITPRKQVEEEMIRLSQAVDASTDSIVISDVEGRIVDANEATLEMYGADDKKDLVGKNSFQLIAPEDQEKAREAMAETLQKGYTENQELKIETKEGHTFPVEMNVSLMRDREGEPTGFVAVIRDITKRKEKERKLRREREILEKVTQNIDAGLTIISKDYRVLWANRLLKKAAGDVEGKLCYQVYNQRDSICPECGVKQVFEEGKERVIHEQKRKCRDGHSAWLQITATPLRDQEGNITSALELSTYLTERKQIEEALRRSEGKYRKQFEGSLDAIVLADAETGEIIDCNPAAAELVGRTKEELIGKPQKILHPPEEIEGRFSRTFKQHLKKKESEVLESQVITKTGEIKDVLIKATRFELEGRKILQGAFRDITERKKKEKMLRESEGRLKAFLDSSGDMAFLKDEEFRHVLVNDAYLDFLGVESREEVLGKTDFDLLPQKLAEQCRESDRQALKEGKPILVVEEGKDRVFETRKFPVSLGDGSVGIGGLIRDVTERKKAEEALRAAEEKYRETVVNANVGVLGYDSEGRVKVVNPRMEQMTGYQREEISTLREWFRKLYPDKEERKRIRNRWFQRMKEDGEVRGGHAIITTKQGKHRHFLFNGVTLKTGEALAFAQDITQQKKMEKEIKEKNEQLRRLNEKLEVVGRMARHDVRNKLSTVTNNLFLAEKKLQGEDPELESYLEDIKQAVGQAKEIFDFAKAYEQLGTRELQPMNVGQAVEEAVHQFSELEARGVEVENRCREFTVQADEMLSRLFYNLIHNSLQHGGEELSKIRVYYRETEDGVELVYEDDGVGIPKEEKERVFREGYGEGTGYGLYLVRKLCEVYGWTIRETGQPGQGARFTITIPR